MTARTGLGATAQEQWLFARIDGSITKFDQHQENDREPMFSGAVISSCVIGKTAKIFTGSQN